MPDINFRLTATDEATPVIDRLRRKMDGMNRPGASSGGSARSSGGSSGNAGTGGFLGSGKIGGVAGLTIIAQAALQALQKIYATLLQASPYLRAVSDQFKVAMSIYLRPLGDSLARVLAPQSEYAIEMAEKRAEFLEDIDERFGILGVIAATIQLFAVDLQVAIWKVIYGLQDTIWNAILGVTDYIGNAILDGARAFGTWMGEITAGLEKTLEDGLDSVLKALSGFADWLWNGLTDVADTVWNGLTDVADTVWNELTNVADSVMAVLSDFGSWLWNGLTSVISGGMSVISGFGTWLMNGIKDLISSGWTTLSGIGSWLFNSIKSALSGIGYEAYRALHNAVASLLNSIANIELPLVGKPFKGLLGTIPMLASGGIVTKPTLAMIGERGAEAVIPLNRGGLGMNQGITVQINAPIYGVTDLESAIDNAIRRSQMGYASYR